MAWICIFNKYFCVLLATLVFAGCTTEAPQDQANASVHTDAAETFDIPTAPVTLPEQRKRLLMHFMPWYIAPADQGNGRGEWGRHWTGHQRQHDPTQIDEAGRRDVWSHYYPLIEPYDSADPDVLECQLLQMKLAGVDGVIVDWYGIANAANYPSNHLATEVMFASAGKLGMEFSVCYEDRTVEHTVNIGHLTEAQTQAHLIDTFQWMKANWFDVEHYTKLDGRPLVLNFGPIYAALKGP